MEEALACAAVPLNVSSSATNCPHPRPPNMQTSDPNYLFQTTSELSNAEKRERKIKAAEKIGHPIKVSSKVLDLLVHDQHAWTAESGWQARKINLAVSSSSVKLY